MRSRRDIWRRTIVVAGWVLLGAGTLSLLIAAVNIGSTRKCAGVEITFASSGAGTYIRVNDILRWVGASSKGAFQGRLLKDIDLRSMEERMEKEPWIQDAELYVDRSRVLHIHVRERRPVARVFTLGGLSFFIDSSMGRIPLSPSHSPRITVFTGLPVSGRSWGAKDSLLMSEVRDVALAIGSDSLLMAQLEQVDLDPVRGFVMVPKMGEHTIVFGDGRGIEEKFRKLKLFYRQVLSQTGWSSYSEIDLRFTGQVVALPTGVSNPDTARAHLPMAVDMYEKTSSASPPSTASAPVSATQVKDRKPKAVMPKRE